MSDEMLSIEGVVTRVFTAKVNDEGTWMPGKLIVLTDDGEVDFIAWPMKDFDTKVVFDPMRMPPWFAALDLETIEGASVKAIAIPRVSAYSGKVEYIKVNSFKVGVLPSQATPVPTGERAATPPPEQPRTYSLDERIAWNSAINNANLALLSRLTGSLADETMGKVYIKLVSALALPFYELIRRGPIEPVEIEDEAVEPEATTLDRF